MNTSVEFLILNTNSQWLSAAIDSLTRLYSEFERVLVVAEDRQLLEQLDELLWHNSAKQFIPYSMDTECYSASVAVLLTDRQPERARYQALLNIGARISIKPESYRAVVELVNTDETSKEQARERYKQYRQRGCRVSHKELSGEK